MPPPCFARQDPAYNRLAASGASSNLHRIGTLMNRLVLLAALPLLALAPAEDPMAPEIDAEGWSRHLGQTPSLQSLRGRAVLIEAWATW